MASTTWVGGDSGNETDWNTGANWSTGSIPTTSAHVVIANTGHNCALDTTRTIGSLTIQASATIVGGGNRLIIQSEGDAAGGTEHYALKNDGIVSGNLHLEFTYAGETAADFNGSSGNFNDIKLNAASVDLNQVGVATFDSLVIVTNAIYDAGNDGLTVTGNTSGAGTLALNNSTYTSSNGHLSMDGGTLTIGTSGVITGVDQLGESGGSKSTITCTGSPTLGCRRWRQLQTHWTPATSTLKVEDGSYTFGNASAYAIPYNFEVDNNGHTNELDAGFTVSNNLTITAGTLDTSSSNHALTVTGYCDVTGTLTLNDSAVSVAALRTNSGAAVTQGSSGTLALATGSDFAGSGSTEGATYSLRNIDGTSDINLGGTVTNSGGSYFEPRTAPDYASVVNNVVWNNNSYWVGKLTFGGTLVVNVHKSMETYNGSKDCIVNGDVTLDGKLKALGNNVNNMEFKSLQINNGGTYQATSGTTTITSRTGGGYSWYAPTTGSIFNHNNGTVKLTYTGNETFWQGTGFYNLEIAGSTHYEHRYSDLTDSSGLIVYNNFTITEGRVRFNQAGDSVTVHGLTKMVGGQYCNTGTAPSGTHNYGNVVIEGGTWKLTSGTCNMSGIRKLGGTLS